MMIVVNKKGFSLVELLAVIVILALITVIGVSSYRSISEDVKDVAYQNKVSLIETKAVEFANSTGYLATNVDELVKSGFLAGDDEVGNVIDPRNNESLNCHVVSMLLENNMLYASYSEEYKECDINNLDRENQFLKIEIHKDNQNGEVVESGIWIKGNAYLVASFKETLNIDIQEIEKIVWFNNGVEIGTFTNFNTGRSKVVEGNIISSNYSVQIQMKNGMIYRAQTLVRIDNERPVVQSVKQEGSQEYAKSKKVHVIAGDIGSGVSSYAITKEANCLNGNVQYEEVNSDEYYKEIEEEGTYYVCVKDKVGNVSEDESTKSIEIKGIDTTKPTCELEVIGTKGENQWYTSEVEVRFGSMSDEESGIATSFIDKQKIDYDTEGIEVIGTVVDNVGNTGTCTVTVKVDKTVPTCELEASGTMGENQWYTSDVNIYFKSQNDVMSGIASSSLSQESITQDTTGVTIIGKVFDKAGNSNTCSLVVKKDSNQPIISVKEKELIISKEDTRFDDSFLDNLETSFGISGKGVACGGPTIGSIFACMNGISCTPQMSQKKGIYPVTCVAKGGNGLVSEPVFFQVYHGYSAPVDDGKCSVRCGSLIPNGNVNDKNEPLGKCECPWGTTYYNQTNCWIQKVPCDEYFCHNNDALKGNICVYVD